MNRPFLERLPVIATALLLVGKMQSGAFVDTPEEDDIRSDTQTSAMDAIADVHEFPCGAEELPGVGVFDKSVFSPEPGKADQVGEAPPDSSMLHEEPFLPSRERKGKKPKREDYDSSCPPPPGLQIFDLDRFIPHRLEKNIITIHRKYS